MVVKGSRERGRREESWGRSRGGGGGGDDGRSREQDETAVIEEEEKARKERRPAGRNGVGAVQVGEGLTLSSGSSNSSTEDLLVRYMARTE